MGQDVAMPCTHVNDMLALLPSPAHGAAAPGLPGDVYSVHIPRRPRKFKLLLEPVRALASCPLQYEESLRHGPVPDVLEGFGGLPTKHSQPLLIIGYCSLCSLHTAWRNP